MDRQEIERKMCSGELYRCGDGELVAEQLTCLDRVFAYNQLPPSRQAEKQALLKEMFAEIGDGCYLETPFYANWGGRHVHFGNRVYANFHLTLVDDGEIYVGDDVMFGPSVILCTAAHPVDPALRRRQLEYNLPIRIGAGAWIGAGTIVLPGVAIGENAVIGAGSVVSRDIPANVVAVGSPCRVLREITPRDRQFYYRDCRVEFPEEEEK